MRASAPTHGHIACRDAKALASSALTAPTSAALGALWRIYDLSDAPQSPPPLRARPKPALWATGGRLTLALASTKRRARELGVVLPERPSLAYPDRKSVV